MNEKAIEQVITDYAIENANLRVAVATLQLENKKLREQEKESGSIAE